jgi:hypothetical protein
MSNVASAAETDGKRQVSKHWKQAILRFRASSGGGHLRKVITSEEVKARWAYAEINSQRFGGTYEANLPSDVYASAMGRVPFENLSSEVWPALLAALKQARNPSFIDKIDAFGAPTYECVEWQVVDLLNCSTLPCFGGMTYWKFLAMPPAVDAAGNLDRGDPRFVSHRIPFDPSYSIQEPLIAIVVSGRPMLIEGYLRSLLWLRNPIRPFLMWLPKL